MNILNTRKTVLCSALVLCSLGESAFANQLEEILVTARKRDESLQEVPVVVNAFSREQIERYAITQIDDLSALVPGLLSAETTSHSPQGTIVLRGVSTGATAAGSDQAVAINVDGVQIEHAMGLRAGQIDLAQIEVLKGPQALFFGKNNSGGVVALKTANPTEENYVKARVGYEMEAEELFGELIVSGPISDNLAGRAVIFATSVDGWLDNVAENPVADSTGPDYDEVIGRVSLLWQPTDRLDVSAKLTHSSKDSDHRSVNQKFFCSNPSIDTDNCKLDDKIAVADPLESSDLNSSSSSFFDSTLTLASLDLSFQLNENLDIDAVTGYYDIEQEYYGNIIPTDVQLDPVTNQTYQGNRYGDEAVDGFSQEIRLTSNYDGPFNFMVGGFYDDRSIEIDSDFKLAFINFEALSQTVDADSISLFGQGTWEINEQWEISAGLRWTDETKKYSGVLLEDVSSPPVAAGAPLVPSDDELSFDNTSPEVTLTWRPMDDIIAYAAYKEGFKSGSFDLSSTSNDALAKEPGVRDISFEPEEVEGVELGFKSTLLENTLRLNIAAYTFEYTNLQLSSFDPDTVATRIINAGESDVEGVEVEFLWTPASVDGLTLNGAIAYNKAEYNEFITNCNQTQITSGNCVLDVAPPDGEPDSQDLAGEPLSRAPEIVANAGFTFERAFGSGDLSYRLGVNTIYSDEYNTDDRNEPNGLQDSYVLVHGNFGIRSENGWSVDLIGRNLTDEYYATLTSNLPFTGGGGQPQDQMGSASRGRQVILQFTIEF